MLASAQAVFAMTGAVPDPDDRVEIDACRRELESRLDADVYSTAVERGRTLTVDEVLEVALAG
jgi:hypothetical protein